jgi:DNA-binding transcriptional regulator YhcF (GntR family)
LKESVAGDKNFELHNLSFNGHEFDSTIAQTDGAVSLGIFAHKTLGRAAFVVARALAYRPLSAREIAETTGVNSRTVYSALDKLESNAMVESSGRGKAWRLTNNFTEQAAQVATEFSTQARSTARKFRHAKERMAWRETVEQRKKAREKQLQSSAHEHFVQQERQSVDA